MRSLLLAGIFLCAVTCYAEDQQALQPSKPSADQVVIQEIINQAENDLSNLYCQKQAQNKEELEQRGCCSWHSGVCDCANGRVVCCDGTFSPTCTCP